MQKRKIDLEEIIFEEFSSSPGDMSKKWARTVAREVALKFGKQLLELAAENAEVEESNDGCRECGACGVSEKSILDTIKQVE